MKKYWLLALLCCVCAVAVSCSDDDDDNGGEVSESAPSVLVTTSSGSDSFTINITTSNGAYQYGYVASTSALSVTAAQILSGSVSGVYSAGVYSASTDGSSKSVVIDAAESTTYYVYAAAVTANGTYSSIASGSVTTLASSSSTDITPELDYATGYYYGDYYTDGTTVEYYIVLSAADLDEDYQTGAPYYILSLRSTTKPTSGTVTIPEGTYTVSDADGNNVIYQGDSYYAVYGDGEFSTLSNFADGSLAVSVSGSTTTIEGTLTDEDGTIHHISYTGDLDIENDAYTSTLSEDVTADLSGTPCYAYYFGDAVGNGTSYWHLVIYKIPGEGFYVDYVGESSFTAEAGIPTGEYTGALTGEAGTYFTGMLYNGSILYSWYFTANSSGSITDPYSPLGSGTITVTNNGDGTYTIAWDVMDDNETYSIKAEWTGTPTVSDETESTSSLSLNSAGPANFGVTEDSPRHLFFKK